MNETKKPAANQSDRAESWADAELDQPEQLKAAKQAFVQLVAKDIKSGRWPENWSTSDLDQYFAELYVGSYPSMYDATCELTDLDALEQAIDELNANFLTVQVYYDIDTSYEALQDCWDIVADPNGTVHVFEK